MESGLASSGMAVVIWRMGAHLQEAGGQKNLTS